MEVREPGGDVLSRRKDLTEAGRLNNDNNISSCDSSLVGKEAIFSQPNNQFRMEITLLPLGISGTAEMVPRNGGFASLSMEQLFCHVMGTPISPTMPSLAPRPSLSRDLAKCLVEKSAKFFFAFLERTSH